MAPLALDSGSTSTLSVPVPFSPQLRQHGGGFLTHLCCAIPTCSPCCRRSVVLVGLLLCLRLCPAFCCPDLHKTRSKCHLVTFSPQSSNAAPHSVPTEKGKKKSCFAERRAERKMWLKSCQKAIHPVQKLQGKALQTESSAAVPALRRRHKAIGGCMANPAPVFQGIFVPTLN